MFEGSRTAAGNIAVENSFAEAARIAAEKTVFAIARIAAEYTAAAEAARTAAEAPKGRIRTERIAARRIAAAVPVVDTAAQSTVVEFARMAVRAAAVVVRIAAKQAVEHIEAVESQAVEHIEAVAFRFALRHQAPLHPRFCAFSLPRICCSPHPFCVYAFLPRYCYAPY